MKMAFVKSNIIVVCVNSFIITLLFFISNALAAPADSI